MKSCYSSCEHGEQVTPIVLSHLGPKRDQAHGPMVSTVVRMKGLGFTVFQRGCQISQPGAMQHRVKEEDSSTGQDMFVSFVNNADVFECPINLPIPQFNSGILHNT